VRSFFILFRIFSHPGHDLGVNRRDEEENVRPDPGYYCRKTALFLTHFITVKKLIRMLLIICDPTAGFGWQKIVKSGKFWFLFSPDYFLVRSVQKLFKLKTREKCQKMDTQ
jgi:hypothetical protein